MALSQQDIESELSYAYLHAVAARAGMECAGSGRHSDNAGVDAFVRYRGPKLAADSTRTDITLEVQLKATKVAPAIVNERYSYGQLTVARYDKLRSASTESQLLLVLFYLPEKPEEWLTQSQEELSLKRCAYWASLRNAPASLNDKYQSIYVPQKNVLSVESLRQIMTLRSREEYLHYEP